MDDAQDALAAEYVLGTLAGDEREHAEALIEIDPGFAEAVQVWERRLGELNVMVEAVEPPPEVWGKIRAELGDVAAPSDIPWADTGSTSPPLAGPPPLPGEAAPPPVPSATKPLAPKPDLVPAAADAKQDAALAAAPSDAHNDAVKASIAASLAKSLVEPPETSAPPLPTGRTDRGAEVVHLQRRVRLWRRVAISAEAIAALLAIYVVAAQFYPALIPSRGNPAAIQTAQVPAAPAARLVGVLQHEPTAPAFLVMIDPQSRSMTVRRVSATGEAGRSYELWLIAKQFPAPRSLGLVGKDEFTERQVPADYDIATLRAASYAVSLEPAGGSPSGVPTGPVLFTGRIVEATPAAPPPAPSQPRT